MKSVDCVKRFCPVRLSAVDGLVDGICGAEVVMTSSTCPGRGPSLISSAICPWNGMGFALWLCSQDNKPKVKQVFG